MHLKSITIRADRFPTRDDYPFNQPLIQETGRIELTTPITFFVGENGTGKSTVMESICRRCGIHIWEAVGGRRFVHNPHERQLYRFVDVEWNDGKVPGAYFGSETFRYLTSSIDEWASADPRMLEYFGGESLVTKSHGQSMLAYFSSRYQIRGLYLLDEPESALSPRSQISLARLLRNMASAGHAQFIVATHSPILLACPGARILSFDHQTVTEIEYRQTEYFRLYRDFMNDPERFLASDGDIAE